MINKVKRTEILFEFLRVLAAMLLAYLLVIICLYFMVDDHLEGIKLFILGPFMTKRRIGNVICRMIPYMITGSGMCFCYAANRFNLSGEGSFLVAGCISTCAAFALQNYNIPHVVLIIILLAVGALCGIASSSVTALMREKLGANEVVVSIMSNYIMLYLNNYILKNYLQARGETSVTSELLPQNALLSGIVKGTDIHSGLYISIGFVLITIGVFYFTPFGTQLKLCGSNEDFGHYVGLNTTSYMIIAQLACGAMCGIAGTIETFGLYSRFQWTNLTQYVYDGLMVAVIARKNPIFIPLGAFLLAYMRTGANVLNFNTSVPIEFVQVMQAVMIICIAGQLFLSKTKEKIIYSEARERLKGEIK